MPAFPDTSTGGQGGAIAAIVLYNGQQDGVDLLGREIGLLVPVQDRTPSHFTLVTVDMRS